MIYFIIGEITRRIKIGVAVDIKTRFAALQSSSPDVLKIIGIYGGDLQERDLHSKFSAHRLHNEWFSYAEEIIDFSNNRAVSYDTFVFFDDFVEAQIKLEQDALNEALHFTLPPLKKPGVDNNKDFIVIV